MKRPVSLDVRRPTSTMRRTATLLIVLLGALPAVPATAAKVYRCGNAFQDQPCPETKIADARPLERPGVGRDAVPCALVGKDGAGRNDCAGKSATEPPRVLGAAARH